VFRLRPDLLVAASVPVLLVAGVLPWQRDVICTESGCGTVDASAWGGSPVWAAVLLAGLALAGAWVLLLPTRARVPLGLAAVTGVVGVVAAAAVVASLDALVFNRAGFFDFDLPVTETFPVLAVHPGAGLALGLAGLLLQAAGGWASLRQRNALVSPLRPPLRATPPGPPPPAARPPGAGPAGPAVPGWPGGAVPGSPGSASAPGRRSAGARPAWVPDPGAGWEQAAFGQGPPAPRRHRRR
jgi:hypothetical protein